MDWYSSRRKVSKKVTRILRHRDLPRGNGTVQRKILVLLSRRDFTSSPNWSIRMRPHHLKKGEDKKRCQCCLDPSISYHTILYIRAIRGHSGGNKIDPTLQENVMMPNDFIEYIYHVGCSHDLHSIIQSELFAGGKDARKGGQTVFFAAVEPMYKHGKRSKTSMWRNQELYFTSPIRRCIRTQCTGSTCQQHKRRDCHSTKQGLMQLSFMTLSQPTVLRKCSVWNRQKFCTRMFTYLLGHRQATTWRWSTNRREKIQPRVRGKPAAQTRLIRTLMWITEFKDYFTQQPNKKTMLEKK